ncbi:MAG: sodium/proline symporter, partial [Planctomycetota bacterium]
MIALAMTEAAVGGATTLILFTLYLGATIGIGLWAARRSGDTQEGFFLGGRSLGPFVVALSAVSSGRSAWLVLGASGAAWAWGYSALWLFPGYILAEWILLGRMGAGLRTRSAEVGAITVPEVMQSLAIGPDGRSGSSRLPIRQLAGLVIVLFLTSYVSAQLAAGGKALEAIFPSVDGRTWGLCITAIIVLGYTLVGGYRAVAITDVIQGVFMLAGLLVLPILGVLYIGGIGSMNEQLLAIDPSLTNLSRGFQASLSGLMIGLGSFGSPPILVRAMSIADASELKRCAWIGATWNILMAVGAMLIGLVGRIIFSSKELFPNADSEHLYPMLGQLLSDEYLFAGFVGVLLAALFAAIMSTCDSQLLVIASSFVRDFRADSRADAAESESGLGGSRLAVLCALAAAVALSFGAERSVKDFVLFAW